MSNRLHTKLDENKWAKRRTLLHFEAAHMTGGNTDKFGDKDYWVTGLPVPKEAKDIPIGAEAVFYDGGHWWLVEKVKF